MNNKPPLVFDRQHLGFIADNIIPHSNTRSHKGFLVIESNELETTFLVAATVRSSLGESPQLGIMTNTVNKLQLAAEDLMPGHQVASALLYVITDTEPEGQIDAVLVPTSVIEAHHEPGSIWSLTDEKYFFNYAKFDVAEQNGAVAKLSIARS